MVLAWLVPFHFLPWVSWQNEVLAFGAVLALALAGMARQTTRLEVRFPFVAFFFSLLAIVAVLQTLAGQITFAGDAFVVVCYCVLCIACLSIGFDSCSRVDSVAPDSAVRTHRARSEHRLSVLAMALVFGAFISALVSFAQVFDLWEPSEFIARMPSIRRPGGNLGQPNQLATLLLMGMASLLFLYESRYIAASVGGMIGLVLIVGVAVTESRTAVLSFAALAAWFLIKRNTVRFKFRAWVLASWALAFVILFWTWPILLGSLLQLDSSATVDLRAGARWIVWPQLVAALMMKPWTGWGIGRVSDALNAVADRYVSSEPFTYSHNILLDLALGIGIPLATLVLVLGLNWLFRRARQANQLTTWYCLALTLPLAIHSMLEFPFAYAYFLVPVMFAIGVLEGTVAARQFISINWLATATALIAICCAMAWSVVEYIAIEEDFRVARFEALRTGKTPADYERPHVFLLTQLRGLLEGARIVPAPGMTRDRIDLARQVALRFPWPATQNRYALSLALNGNPDEALRQLKVLHAMHGELMYASIKANWEALARDKYPQLAEFAVP